MGCLNFYKKEKDRNIKYYKKMNRTVVKRILNTIL